MYCCYSLLISLGYSYVSLLFMAHFIRIRLCIAAVHGLFLLGFSCVSLLSWLILLGFSLYCHYSWLFFSMQLPIQFLMNFICTFFQFFVFVVEHYFVVYECYTYMILLKDKPTHDT